MAKRTKKGERAPDGSTTVHLNEELRRTFAARAVKLGIKQKEAFDEALRLWLETHGEPLPAPPPPEPTEEDRYVQILEQLIRYPKGETQRILRDFAIDIVEKFEKEKSRIKS